MRTERKEPPGAVQGMGRILPWRGPPPKGVREPARRFPSRMLATGWAPGCAPLPPVATEGRSREEVGQPPRFSQGAATTPRPLRAEAPKEPPGAVQGMGRVSAEGSPSGLTDAYNMLLVLHSPWRMEQGWLWPENLPAVELSVPASGRTTVSAFRRVPLRSAADLHSGGSSRNRTRTPGGEGWSSHRGVRSS